MATLWCGTCTSRAYCAARGVLHDAALQLADALDDALPQADPRRHLPDLVLQRGAAAVDDEDLALADGVCHEGLRRGVVPLNV